MEPDKIYLSLKDNPELAAQLAGASAGDTVVLSKVEFTIDEVSDDLVSGSIEGCEDCKLEPDEEKDPEEVDENAPVMQVMTSKEKTKY